MQYSSPHYGFELKASILFSKDWDWTERPSCLVIIPLDTLQSKRRIRTGCQWLLWEQCRWSWPKHCFLIFFKVYSDHFALTYAHECIVSPPDRLVLLKKKKSATYEQSSEVLVTIHWLLMDPTPARALLKSCSLAGGECDDAGRWGEVCREQVTAGLVSVLTYALTGAAKGFCFNYEHWQTLTLQLQHCQESARDCTNAMVALWCGLISP